MGSQTVGHDWATNTHNLALRRSPDYCTLTKASEVLVQIESYLFGAFLMAQTVESASSAGDSCLIPGSERSFGEGKGNSLQHFCHGERNQVGYSPWGCRVAHDWMINAFTFTLALNKRNMFAIHSNSSSNSCSVSKSYMTFLWLHGKLLTNLVALSNTNLI